MKTIQEAVREVIQNKEELKRVLKMKTKEEVIECIKAHDCEATIEEARAEFAKQYESHNLRDVSGGCESAPAPETNDALYKGYRRTNYYSDICANYKPVDDVSFIDFCFHCVHYVSLRADEGRKSLDGYCNVPVKRDGFQF